MSTTQWDKGDGDHIREVSSVGAVRSSLTMRESKYWSKVLSLFET